MKIAVFPGSFDPITRGHEALVNRALTLFDKIIVAIGVNANKNYLFSLDTRKKAISQSFGNHPKIEVDHYSCLTIDYCREMNANFILRGLRTSADFNFERSISQMNQAMNRNIETVFLMTEPELSAINSSIVRDIIRNGGNAQPFLPGKLDIKELDRLV